MSRPSYQQIDAASATPAPALVGSSMDDHAEVSSCFVSSPSSSTSSRAVLDANRVDTLGSRAHHQHQHQHQVNHSTHPPTSGQSRPTSHPSDVLFPNLNVLDSDDNDSLRVSSSTLFHDDNEDGAAAAATTATGSNLSFPDDSPASEIRRRNPNRPDVQERGEDRGVASLPAVPPHVEPSLHRPVPGDDPTVPVRWRQGGLDSHDHGPTVNGAVEDPTTLHADVYECLCSSPAVATAEAAGGREADGIGQDGFFFAPRNFKRTLANTLLERMRSRADTTSAMMLAVEGDETAHEPNAIPTDNNKKPSSPMAVLDEMEERMLRDTVLAKKRVRVVQLLIVGLVSLLFGWLGNFFVTSSCHFASSTVSVGQYNDPLSMNYGLWKYSPVDSALSGSYACYPYHSAQHRAPIVARIANLLALLLGTYSQVCVWAYLISGRWNPQLWKAAVYTAAVAGVLQLLTLCFFVERVCWSNRCRMGPASGVAVITAIVWFVFAWEVHYNTPRGAESIVSLEMRDLRRASAEYMTRFQPEKAAGYYRPPEIM